MTKKFNFAEAREKAIRAADQELEQGMEKVIEGGSTLNGGSEQGGVVAVAQQQTEPAAEPRPATEQPVPAAKDEAAENTAAAKDAEPTKGVQTYIAVSMYRRLSDIKLTRGETIGNLVAEAVALWLDVQEGKAKVEKVSATT